MAASFRRGSAWLTARTSPERPISPNTTVSSGTGLVAERRDQGRGDRQVGRRLGDPQAAGDVEIDVLPGEAKPAARLQHGQHHGEAAGVPADHGAPRRAERRGRDQRLDLDQHRARALHAGEDRRRR